MYDTRMAVSSSGVTTGLSTPTSFLYSPGTKSTSLSDANGNLLFAFNGNTVVDADLNIMPALTSIDLGAYHGKTLIQQIRGTTQYYVFYATQNVTSDANSPWTLKYLVVDLSLQGGKGDITTYNQVISTTSSPSYTLVESEDGSDIWLVTHKCASDTFYSYKIIGAGLSGTAVVSKAGSDPAGNEYVFKSLKTSFNGKMIAGYSFRESFDVFSATECSINVFDFNVASGQLTHRVHTNRGKGSYYNSFSLEFSPDNRLLYVGSVARMAELQPCGFGSGYIRQYNLCYTNSAEFDRYSMTIAGDLRPCAPFTTWGAMQMGANKRIHIPFTGNIVSNINKPNRIGSSCDFVFDSYQLPEYNNGTIVTPDFHHRMMDRAVRNNIVYEGGCFPSPVKFSVTNDKISSIDWDFGDPSSAGNTVNSIQPSHVFSAPGHYTIRARFLNNITGKLDTIEELIEIKDPGKRLLDGYPKDTAICDRDEFTISLKIVNGLYQWYQIENNQKIYLSEPSDNYSISSAGMHYVELRWNDCNGCVLVDSINITIKPKPWTYLGNDAVLCSGDSLKVGFNEPDTRYLWSTGQTTPEITIKNGGVYWLEAEYNSNGCILRDSMLVTELQGVQFSLPADTVLCNDEQLLLEPVVTGAGTYQWQDGSVQPQFTVTQPGVYHLQVTSVDYCVKRDTIVVDYIRTGSISLGNDTILCNGDRLELTTGIVNADLLWSTGSTASGIDITQTDTYWLNVSRGSCNASDTIVVQFMPPPVFDLGRDTTICAGLALTLNPSVPGADYTWQDLSTNSTYTVDNPGVFSVTVKQFGCVVHDTITVSYFDNTTINLGDDVRFCEGDSVLLDAGIGFTDYNWNNGSNARQQFVKEPGVYSVTALSAEGCKVGDTMSVLPPYPLPKPELGKSRGICEGEAIFLDGGAGFYSYHWNTGDQSRTLKVWDPGLYVVEVEDEHGCRGIDSVNIPVRFKPPSKFLRGDTSICSYGEILLKPEFTYESYLWSTGGREASLLVTTPGTYRLTVKDKNGCMGYDSTKVHLKECMEGIFVPNAFTPNADGKNDGFTTLIHGTAETYLFQIYNRFGHLVFQSNTPGERWDGTYQGREQNGGIYIWKCIFKLKGKELQREKGTVLLIR